MKRIDLHAHTVHSDGTLSPSELVQLAHEAGLGALAVTDHDTTTGLAEARAVGESLGVEVLDGCEVTARLPSGIVHLLAYGFAEEDAGFQGLLEEVRYGRDKRNEIILEKLAALNVPLDIEEVRALAHGCVIARPHIAQAMLLRGYVDDIREAFQHYLKDSGRAYAQAPVPAAEVAIETIVRAGGVAVVAHPRSLKLEGRRGYAHTIGQMKEAGLGGIEVNHPSQDSTWRALFSELAVEFDLVTTGGSDFHGSNKPHIKLGSGDGSIDIRYDTWERLRERMAGAGTL